MKKNEQIFNNGLYLVSTPIGNLQDLSLRALNILKKSDTILCENPKHSIKILNKYDIKKKMLSIHDYNENKIIHKISNELNKSIICLISDAGSPLISDPGFKLISYCIENNIYFTSVPGSSSIIPAIQLSGLSPNSFTFHGFIPKKIKKTKEYFNKIKNLEGSQIFFSSSHKLKENIEIMEKSFGNRQISICKELTKINEQIIRTNLKKALEHMENKKAKIKGEFIIVMEGNKNENVELVEENIIKSLIDISSKFSLTDTVKIVHKLTNISKKKLYDIAIKKIKKEWINILL